ncbi:uncharacterized protein LOC130898489 isoform X2 [Diorhabda carinulata]|nr:uncharacterized protein LOC130898489 isoform X2 [Diorhabda carinulata]
MYQFLRKPNSNSALENWSPKPIWTKEELNLLKELTFSSLPTCCVDDIVKKSDAFPLKFPTTTNKCAHLKLLVSENVLNRNINSAYPVIHASVLKLCCDFLLYKRQHGSNREQKYYKNKNVMDLINRLLVKRPAVFVGPDDKYLLLDGTFGRGSWENIGTDYEKPPLTLDNYLSYDELKISSLLSISSYTHFMNKGHRSNSGVYEEDRSAIEGEGIIIGIVGPRLPKTNAVENQEIIFSKQSQTKENGFGKSVINSIPKLFADFYGEECLDYKEMLKKKADDTQGRYVLLLKHEYIFDNIFYYKRLTISIDTLLGEANTRGKNASKFSFLHVVGIGLGVWKISPHQDKAFMDAFASRILSLGPKLHQISDICFAYINETKCGDFGNGEAIPIENHPNGGIRIHIQNRHPHQKLINEHEDKLLVVSYAWDGNSLPGNEYWSGSLRSSSDPAAACSTQITELHNPHINTRICADNLKIVTEGDVISLQDYLKTIPMLL